ncbi:MAG: hypothetical protein NC222_06210 [Staphylococcus sp.]|nr:hypothetical protein [Staphylococcus sp.]
MKYIFSNETPNQPKPTEPAGMGLIWAWEPTSNIWIRVKEDEAFSTVKQQNQNSYNQTNNQTENTSTVNYTTAKLEENSVKEMEQKLALLIEKNNIFDKNKADEDLIKAGFIEYAGYNLSKGAQYRVSQKGLDFSNKYNLNLAKKDFIDIKSSKEEEIENKQIKDIEPIEKEVERNYTSKKCSLVINFKDRIEASLAKEDLTINGYKTSQKEEKLFIETNKKAYSNLKTSLTELLSKLGFEKVNYDI